MVIGDRKVKVIAWYDNEWGYSARVVDLTKKVAACISMIYSISFMTIQKVGIYYFLRQYLIM